MPKKFKLKHNSSLKSRKSSNKFVSSNSLVNKSIDKTDQDLVFTNTYIDSQIVTTCMLHNGFSKTEGRAKPALCKIVLQQAHTIAYKSFSRLPALREVIIEDTDDHKCKLHTIEKKAFSFCSVLENFDMPNSVVHLGVKAFLGCKSLRRVTLSNKLKHIDQETFRDCKNLKEIAFPHGIKKISASCLQGCSQLTSVSLPDSLQTLGEQVFTDCSRLKELIIPMRMKNFSLDHISDSSIEHIVVPDEILPKLIDELENENSVGTNTLKITSYSQWLIDHGVQLTSASQPTYAIIDFLSRAKHGSLFLDVDEIIALFSGNIRNFSCYSSVFRELVSDKQKYHMDLATQFVNSSFDPMVGFFTWSDRENLRQVSKSMNQDSSILGIIHARENNVSPAQDKHSIKESKTIKNKAHKKESRSRNSSRKNYR